MRLPARRTAPDPTAAETAAHDPFVPASDLHRLEPTVGVTGRPDADCTPAQAGRSDRVSVRGAVLLALAGLLALAVGIGPFTRHNLVYRIHDYAILNLAGQLRELSNGMGLDARQMVRTDDAAPGPAELTRYREKLAQQVAQYDRIVQSFVDREL